MNHEFKHFDLYAGIRGFSLAFESEGFTTVGCAEIDDAANSVGQHWYPNVPNFGDVRAKYFCERVRAACGEIDVITAGTPCQPASLLGKRRGTSDERWLWPDNLRICRALRPRFFVAENPPALLTLERGDAFNGIVSGLAALGYDLLWEVLPAAAFGAGHLRERLIIVAWDTNRRDDDKNEVRTATNTNDARLQGHTGQGDRSGEERRRDEEQRRPVAAPDLQSPIANSDSINNRQHVESSAVEDGQKNDRPDTDETRPAYCVIMPDLRGRVASADWWNETHTGVPVLAHGISARLAEAATRCAGNSVVPQVIQPIAAALYKLLIVTPPKISDEDMPT